MDALHSIGIPSSVRGAEETVARLKSVFKVTLDPASGLLSPRYDMGEMSEVEATEAREVWNAQWMAVTLSQISVAERNAAADSRAYVSARALADVDERALMEGTYAGENHDMAALVEDSLKLLHPDGSGALIPEGHLRPIGMDKSGGDLRHELREKFPYVLHYVRCLRNVFNV